MRIVQYIEDVGSYFNMIKRTFSGFTKGSVMRELIFKEIDDLILDSLYIVSFISFFVGGVVAIQTALNMDNPLIPKSLVGFATRQSVILEFSPTIISIIMAGKAGSFITSSLGSMRVTEQIDALEVMGVNSLNYLVFPKIIAMLLLPFLIVISMGLGILGGAVASVYGGLISMNDYVVGLQQEFVVWHVQYAFIKTFIFAFILATVPSWQGYYMKGGALEVGKASTNSFVWTSILIIAANFITTQLLLS